MEIGPVSRPGLPNVGSVSRVAPTPSAVSAEAQMPERAVEQPSELPRPEADAARNPMADADAVDRRIKIDPATQQVIYQTVDKVSGEVVRQIPEETMLRLQVYARAMRRAAAESLQSVGKLA